MKLIARYSRVARITALGEFSQPIRLTATAARLTIQVVLVSYLWRALYSSTTVSAGLDRAQAVSYAVLAALTMVVRGFNRVAARDTVLFHVQTGTILYWYIRPLSARRYYFVRATGDQAYGLAWLLLGFLLCLASGVVMAPVSFVAALASVASFILGQMIFYYLVLFLDQLCFWTIMNNNALLVLQFAQNLFSGSFAPLWFFPAWFVTASVFLPFQGTLNVPLSLYVGRIPISAAPEQVAIQLGWCLLFAGLGRRLWQHADARVAVQGG